MLYDGIKVFESLAPDFQANYGENEPESLFLQQNECGSLSIDLECYGNVKVDALEFYTQKSEHIVVERL